MRNASKLGAIAWVTGAGKGIGRALALKLAEEGMTVAASARSEADLKILSSEAENLTGSIAAWPLDVTDEEATVRVVEAIEDEHGPIDLVILNAGTHIPQWASAFDTGAVRTLVEVNFMGAVHGFGVVMPLMIKRRKGQIAVMSSVAGYRGLPGAAGYGATKSALINLCEALKPDLDRYGVVLSVICPGFVRTPLTDRNTFPMPFLIEPEIAAEKIVVGLLRGRFEIAFPRRFTGWMKLLRYLPNFIFFCLTRRLVARNAG